MAKEVKKIKISFCPANRRGSILTFSLIIMFVLMIIAIGVATVSVKERRMSLDTGKSVIAYQAADSGAEIALDKIMKDGWTVNDFNMNMGCSVINGKATVNVSAPSGEYDLTFEDAGGSIESCSNTNIIKEVKSLGKYSGTNRAVEISL